MKRVFLPALALLVGSFISTGCASKGYVQQQIQTLDKKVADSETAIEENQKRIKEHDERLVSLGSLISQQSEEVKEVRKFAQGKLILKEVIKNSDSRFKRDSAELSPEAKASLDKFVQDLIALDRGLYLEIQGHTDKTGSEPWNQALGKKRAEAVMEYLYKQHKIPLHRMQVVSFGSSVPVAENNTKEVRNQNRRVENLVFE